MRGTMVRASLFACALLAARPAAAQETPEEVAGRYFRVTQAEDWKGAARMMHPRALEAFKAMLVDLAAADEDGVLFPRVFAIEASAVRGTSAADLFARAMERLQARQDGLGEMMRSASFTLLGHVMEGDTAHVVYRLSTRVMDAPVSQTGVVSLLRDGQAWKPLLNADVQNLFAAMRVAVEHEEELE
ncbi:MAG TPA: hypothetical protein VFQ39_20520 [Longimicrobium sp.]|nr:hypothetical protein [Longimicrobium sp.]